MGYEKYTDPGSGYGPHTSPGEGYPTAAVPSYLTTPTPKGEERADFTYLSTIKDGVGNYHMNHFVAYFEPTVDKFQPVTSIKFFYQNFCKIFSLNNVATVAPERARKFKGLDVVKFTIGGNLGKVHLQLFGRAHDDWVAMQMAKDGKSFYGITLKREWFEAVDNWEKVINAGSPKVGPAVSPMLMEANRRHFLAGRRSWRVDYDRGLGLYYVETAAFERSSHVLYQATEQTGLLRETIRELWTNQLENYPVTLCPIKAMNLVPTGYEAKGNVAYKTGEDASAQKALLTDWFSEVLKRHPGLVTDL